MKKRMLFSLLGLMLVAAAGLILYATADKNRTTRDASANTDSEHSVEERLREYYGLDEPKPKESKSFDWGFSFK